MFSLPSRGDHCSDFYSIGKFCLFLSFAPMKSCNIYPSVSLAKQKNKNTLFLKSIQLFREAESCPFLDESCLTVWIHNSLFILSLDGCTVESLLLGFGFLEISLFVNLCTTFCGHIFHFSQVTIEEESFWVRWWMAVYLYKQLLNCFPKLFHHFTSPSAVPAALHCCQKWVTSIKNI